jgi:uncharacterized protein YyaL (SSP411 family)
MFLIIKKLEKSWRREQQRMHARVRKRTRRLQNEQSKKEDEEESGLCRAVPEVAKRQRPLMGTFKSPFSFFLFLFSHFCGLSLKTKH